MFKICYAFAFYNGFYNVKKLGIIKAVDTWAVHQKLTVYKCTIHAQNNAEQK